MRVQCQTNTGVSAYRATQNSNHHIWRAYVDKSPTKTLFINKNLDHHTPHLSFSIFRFLHTTTAVNFFLFLINRKTIKAYSDFFRNNASVGGIR